jgi:mono/diheme cytochrome c family protein
MGYRIHIVVLIVILTMLLVACAEPQSLPAGPTPIPTLIPATEFANPPGSAATPAFTLLSYPARLPSAAIGQPLYQTHCATCHGADGKGVVPGARNFNDLDYMRGETPANFYTIVTEGRGEMPSFRDALTSDERWDVVFYTWRFSTNADTLAHGKGIYDVNCAACHGEDGVGKVLGASDFTDLRFVDERAPRDFYLTVTQGIGSMPAWQGRLSQEERWAVIDYLRTFSYDPALPGETAETPVVQATAAEVTCTSDYISPPNPFAWDDATAIASGQAIYEQSCSMCHGKDGSGAIPGTTDFTTAEWQDELHSENEELPCVVAEGRGAMPGWKETLSQEQIWQVLTYIGSIVAP